MAILSAINPEKTSGKTKEIFTSIEGSLGMVPNMIRTMANSPAVLEGYLSLSSALGSGSLGSKTGHLIALAVSEKNSCNYCLAAHAYFGANLNKIDASTMEAARHGISTNPKTDAILKFANLLVDRKGIVNEQDVNKLKDAGITEGEISEIVGHVALNILTNYFNNTAKTEIDFPAIEALTMATV